MPCTVCGTRRSEALATSAGWMEIARRAPWFRGRCGWGRRWFARHQSGRRRVARFRARRPFEPEPSRRPRREVEGVWSISTSVRNARTAHPAARRRGGGALAAGGLLSVCRVSVPPRDRSRACVLCVSIWRACPVRGSLDLSVSAGRLPRGPQAARPSVPARAQQGLAVLRPVEEPLPRARHPERGRGPAGQDAHVARQGER